MWLLALTYGIDAFGIALILLSVWVVGMMVFLIARNLWRRVRYR